MALSKEDKKFELAAGRSLSAEEAERMLVRLKGYFKEPVQPVSKYCKALRTWQKLLEERLDRERFRLFPDTAPGTEASQAKIAWAEYYTALNAEFSDEYSNLQHYHLMVDYVRYVFIQISKSNLLYRLIYLGKEPMKEMCPVHKGRWSGIPSEPPECGCDALGWLPDEK